MPKHEMPGDFRKRNAAVALSALQDIRATTQEVAEQAQDSQTDTSSSETGKGKDK